MSCKLVIVGGVAGGATAAARARRLDERAEIILFERGSDVSFANCGLPYYVGGQIEQRQALLVQTKLGLETRFALDVRTHTEVLRINRAQKTVTARTLSTGREYDEPYDHLVLAPGAAPLVPPIPGVTGPRVFTLRNLPDVDLIKKAVDRGGRRAVVIGGGFIGLEMTENFRRRGMDVALVELAPQVMPPLDPEMAARLHVELQQHGVQLYLADAVTAIADEESGARVQLRSGRTLPADLVLLAVGVRPDTRLAAEAGLALDERGAIIVDEHLCTSDPAIHAVGDAIQTQDPVLGGPVVIPLAGPANRQARIAVDHIFGRPARYRGTLGTGVVRVFGVTAALTGASERTLRGRGVPYRKVIVHRPQHVTYFPGAQPMMIKLLFAPDTGRILGAQIVGGDGVDKRIDVLATALHANLTVRDLHDLELAYAPQFGAAKDPVNIAGYVAANVLDGAEQFIDPAALPEAPTDEWTLLDVREPSEYRAGHVAGALHIPLGELRDRLDEIPRDKPVAVYCAAGQRAYYATRVLRAAGVDPLNVMGGFATYTLSRPAGR